MKQLMISDGESCWCRRWVLFDPGGRTGEWRKKIVWNDKLQTIERNRLDDKPKMVEKKSVGMEIETARSIERPTEIEARIDTISFHLHNALVRNQSSTGSASFVHHHNLKSKEMVDEEEWATLSCSLSPFVDTVNDYSI